MNFMVRRLRWLLMVPALAIASSAFGESALEQAAALQERGEFKRADAVLTAALKDKNLSAADKKKIEWEKDRLWRIRDDYSLTTDALYAKLAGMVKNLKRSEFEQWISKGWFDGRIIDGTMYYVG